MKPRQLRLAGPLCGLLSIASLSTAHAEWYAGANVGQSSIDTSAGEIEQAFLIDDSFVASGTTLDKTDTGWKGYVGYRFIPLLSLEVGYANLGKATFNTTIAEAPPPFGDFTPFDIEGTATADGPQASVLLHVPLLEPMSAFARAGAFRWEAEFTEFIPDAGTTRVARTEARIDPMYGIGLQLQFAALGARLEWERLESVGEGIGDREGRDIDYFSAGVIVEF